MVSNLVYISDGPDVLRLTYTKQSPETVNAAPRGLLRGGAWASGVCRVVCTQALPAAGILGIRWGVNH